MNFSLLISQGDSDSSDIVQLKAGVILMEVRGYPAHPNAAGLLTREDPHWVVVLHLKKYNQVRFILSPSIKGTWLPDTQIMKHTEEACMRNSYSSLSSVITSSDTRADEGQLLSGLFLFNVNLTDQKFYLVL